MQVESTGTRIKKAIKNSGIKLTHIADKLGVTPPQLAQIFKNTTGRSKYLSHIAEILNVSEKWLETGTLNARLYIAQILDVQDLLSLFEDGSAALHIDELSSAVFDSIPIYSDDTHYQFGFKISEPITDDIRVNDILIIDTFLPLKTNLNAQILIVFSKSQKALVIGKANLKEPTDPLDKMIITNNQGAYLFLQDDLIVGVCDQVIIPSLQLRGKTEEIRNA